MSQKKTVGIIIIVLLALMLIAGALYIHSLTKIELKDVRVINVHTISLEGFLFDGEIDVYNGGFISTGIDHIEYTVILESSGAEVAEGYIQGGTIPSKEVTTFTFSNKVRWGPSIEGVIDLIMTGNLTLKISGTVYVADLTVTQVAILFEQRSNVADYLKYYVAELLIQKPTVAGITTAIKKIGEFLGQG